MPSDDKPDEPSSTAPARKSGRDISSNSAVALAFELPFTLVGPVVVGAAIGYFLDHRLNTRPWFTLILGAVGFFAGVREVLRRLPAGNGNN